MKINHKKYSVVIVLFLIFLIGFFIDTYLYSNLKYSLHPKEINAFKFKIYWLPAILSLVTLLKIAFKLKAHIFNVLFYIAIFFLFSPSISISVFLTSFLILFYYLEYYTRGSQGSSYGLFLIIILFVAFQFYVYQKNIHLSQLGFWYLLIIKSALLMRILSWVVDRRIYKRDNYDGILSYLEYMFCPVFFIYPGHIQYFLYGYFHQAKKEDFEVGYWDSLKLCSWAYFTTIVFSFFDSWFWEKYYIIPKYFSLYGYWTVHFCIGLFWLFLIYFSQVSIMSFQVLLARCLGYNFKYDMHLPLLSLSPLDYLRRHSSYVRDYIVEVGLRPLYLVLIRKGHFSFIAQTLVAIFSYAILIFPQVGYRSDYDRSLAVGLVMITFLGIFLLIPYLSSLVGVSSLDTLDQKSNIQSIKKWRFMDYVKWIFTLILLAIYKMTLGLVK